MHGILSETIRGGLYNLRALMLSYAREWSVALLAFAAVASKPLSAAHRLHLSVVVTLDITLVLVEIVY